MTFCLNKLITIIFISVSYILQKFLKILSGIKKINTLKNKDLLLENKVGALRRSDNIKNKSIQDY